MIKSLFIPHVFPNYDEEAIRYCFMDICAIDHIDMIQRMDKTGKQYNAVYVHVDSWFDWNDECKRFLADIEEKGKTEFYYCDKFYWIVLKNTAKKHVSGERKIRIDLGDLERDKENECVHTPTHKVTTTTPGAPMKIKPIGPIAPTLCDMFHTPPPPCIGTLKQIKLTDLFDACRKNENDKIIANMRAELHQAQIDDIDNAMDEMDGYIEVRADYLYELALQAYEVQKLKKKCMI